MPAASTNSSTFDLTSAGTVYADVIVPLAVSQTYTFSVPEEMVGGLQRGLRVEVQFGKNKHYTGIIDRLHGTRPDYGTKAILSVIDTEPSVTDKQIDLWKWMADYYVCNVGEVMTAGLPAHLKLTSETLVTLGPLFSADSTQLDDEEYMIVEALTIQRELTLKDIQGILQKKTVLPIIRRLIDRRIVYLQEELVEKYKPKAVKCVRFTAAFTEEDSWNDAFEKVARSEKQTTVLLEFIQVFRTLPFVRTSDLTKRTEATGANVRAIEKKGIFEIYEREISRISEAEELTDEDRQLSTQQVTALEEIDAAFRDKKPVLLHGVTGSGKTRVYLELMEATLAKQEQVLYLLPEIALTSQIVKRLQQKLGDQVVVYHSRLDSMERVEIWKAVLRGEKSVIGARSAIFLPFKKLGLVIVDEEHDPSYKQQAPNPRYNGRDVAVYLAHTYGAPAILGTATPSLESWENTVRNKYRLVRMPERFGGIHLPQIGVTNAREANEKGHIHPFFTPTLINEIKATLGRKEQVILFQNRRGFAPTYFCATCDLTVQCVNCDVSLTYHKFREQLRCHCCGYSRTPPETCPACGSLEMKLSGTGTEKIEDELKIILPEAKVARMDLDTTRGKNALTKLISQFEAGDIDILVGTQMVTKGLDFERVGLVGVINADQILHYPDFRSDERAYHLMTQVSGRAGRRHRQGKVIIQATDQQHVILRNVVDQNWNQFIEREQTNRRETSFPPYVKMIHLQLRHPRRSTALEAAKLLHLWLAPVLGETITAPFEPSVARLRNYYLQDMVVRINPSPREVKRVKGILRKAVAQLNVTPKLTGVRVVLDVDPY
ncbi:replication restart helicase PriA [Neolewinella antarctica]|uniref:Replication restart protein PriA n=1 Tax=Neolewinella antarctica TaxID=442734 RepID=A0ABX0XDA8_9BACT|nr:primosomal protein N' [Neolewinella antarctica]NJC27294.1 primosomal protein N' (replication factor Y) [Neolewinella antarctica]